MPVFGFYLQPAVGGRVLPYAFWREFARDRRASWAIKIAPFDRYQTLDVVRAVAESGRDDIALYTGNDDSIIADLLTPFPVVVGGAGRRRGASSAGCSASGRCGRAHAVRAARPGEVRTARRAAGGRVAGARPPRSPTRTRALFDAANGFAGCIPGIHEVLRRQGLMRGTWCLDPHEQLSPGQAEEIDRVLGEYPELTDDEFVAEHREEWLRD